MMFIEEAIEIFHTELPEEIQLSCEADKVMKPLKELGQSYGLDLSALVVFCVIGELTIEDMPHYLQTEFDVSEEVAKKLTKEIDEKIMTPLYERVNFLNDHPDKDLTLEQEKIYVDNIFKKGLLPELSYDPIIKAAVNRRLFFILARELDFKKRLEQSMYENEEVIGTQKIMVDGQEKPATISNWLKDYLARFGSQAFNSVSMSSFLINSENGKKLSTEDRNKLTDILKIYINIKFFPDSMPSDEGDDWQIIPYEVKEKPILGKAEQPVSKEQIIAPVITKAEVRAAKPSNPIVKEKIKAVNQEAPVKKSEIKISVSPAPVKQIENKPLAPITPTKATAKVETNELLELKNMLLQYPEGSIQRAAIEEEIKTLENS